MNICMILNYILHTLRTVQFINLMAVMAQLSHKLMELQARFLHLQDWVAHEADKTCDLS